MKPDLSYQDILQIIQLVNAADCGLHLKYGDLVLDVEKKPGASNANPVSTMVEAQSSETPRKSSSPMEIPNNLIILKSPMVGTFYRSAGPGESPFVELGQKVSAQDTVCIIEVMKLFNSIAAGATGVITHVFVEDGHAVEYGQPLLAIDTADE